MLECYSQRDKVYMRECAPWMVTRPARAPYKYCNYYSYYYAVVLNLWITGCYCSPSVKITEQSACVSQKWFHGGSIDRASDSRFYDISDLSFNPIGDHKKKFFQVKNVVLTHCQCAQPLCVLLYYARIRMITYAHEGSCSPYHRSLDYGNMKRPSMHFTDRRINVHLYSIFK